MNKKEALDWLNTYHPICDAADRLHHLVTPEWEGQGCRLCPLCIDGHCHSARGIEYRKIKEKCEQVLAN
jgi:hypothetical protein